MCLGIPGRVVERLPEHEHLARVDVEGVGRVVNVGLLDEPPVPGDWVLIHVGFAMAKIDEEEAERALDGLRLIGGLHEEMGAWRASPARDEDPA